MASNPIPPSVQQAESSTARSLKLRLSQRFQLPRFTNHTSIINRQDALSSLGLRSRETISDLSEGSAQGLSLRLHHAIWLIIFYLFIGIFFSTPWRGYDADSFSVVLGLVGHAFFRNEFFQQEVLANPGYYYLLALGAKVFNDFMPMLNAMRLTNALLLLSCVLMLYRSVRFVYSAEVATMTVLLMMTSIGGFEMMHITNTGSGTLLALCLSIYGLLVSQRRVGGGLFLGLGLLLVMTTNILGLIPVLLMTAWLFYKKHGHETRRPIFLWAWLMALVVTAVGLIMFYVQGGWVFWREAVWPIARLSMDGRDYWDGLTRLIWFTWPLWPAYAGYRLYARKKWPDSAQQLLGMGLIGAGAALPLSLVGAESSMLMLPFFALLFAPAYTLTKLHWLRGWHWFNLLFFSVLFLALIVFRVVAQIGHWPPMVELLSKHVPGFNVSLSYTEIIFTVLPCLMWVLWHWRFKRYFSWSVRPVLGWSIGFFLLWFLYVVLWLPLVTYTKSYASVVKNIKTIVGSSCVDATYTHRALQVSLFHMGAVTLKRNRDEAGNSTVDSCPYQLRLISDATVEPLSPVFMLDHKSLSNDIDNEKDTVLGDDGDTQSSITPLPKQWRLIGVYKRTDNDHENHGLYVYESPNKQNLKKSYSLNH